MEVEALNKPTSSSLATTTTTNTESATITAVETTSEKKESLLDQETGGGGRGTKNQRLRNNTALRQSKSTVLNGKSTTTKSTPLTNGHSKRTDPVVDNNNEDTVSSTSSSSKEMTAKTDNENLSTTTAGRSVSPTKLAANAESEKKTKNNQATTRATRKSLQLLNNKTNNCSNTETTVGNKNIVNNVITEDENAMDGFVSMNESRNVVENAKTVSSIRIEKSTTRRSVSSTKAASNTSLIHTLIREETENEESATAAEEVNMDDQNASCSVNMTLSNNNRANLDDEESTMLDNNSMDVSSQQPLDSNKEGTNDAAGGTMKKARRKKRSSLIVNGQFNQGHIEVNKIFVYKWPMSEAEEETFKSNLEQIQQNQQQDQHDSTSQNSMSVSRSAMSLVNSDPLWKIYLTPSQDDLYVLQEQISEYLQVKSFKRKYPDIERRFVDVKEREFLRDFRIVTETMCDLGLNALRLGDVLDLMGDEYPDKYAEFSAHLAEKKRKAVTIAKTNAMQLLAAQNQDEEDSCSNLPAGSVNKKLDPAYAAQKMKDLIRKAVLSASNYNRQLVKEKKEERRTCFDLQTMRVLKPRREIEKAEIVNCTKGPYPVALIHGQYQNYYKRYSSGELKYLPLNTAIYETDMPKKLEYLESKRPKHPQQQQHQPTNVLRRASTVSSHLTLGGSTVLRSPASSNTPNNHIRHILDPSAAASSSSLSPLVRRSTLDQDSMNTSLSHMKATPIQASSIISTSSTTPSASSTSRYSIRITASPASKSSAPSSNAAGILKTCYICNKECNQPAVSAQAAQFSDKNNDILIDCSSCSRSAHPLCLELNADLVDWVCIRQYEWQCLDCKKCSQCSKSNDEDKMMFCDRCDRGFHTYCVGVDQVPDGAWLCLKCKQFKERLASINEKINAMKQQQNNTNHVISPRVSSTVSSSGGAAASNKIRQIITTTTPIPSRHSESKHASPSFVPEKRGRGRPPGSTNKPKDAYSPKKLKQEFGKPHKINSIMMNGYNQPSPSAYDLMDSNSMMSTGSASTPAMVYNNYGDSSVANSSLENYYSYGQTSSTVYIQPQQQQSQAVAAAQSTQFHF